jgi:glycosyltransferase involved in cell wall biosynthesis
MDLQSHKSINAEDRRIMLFDLSIRGHHPSYIQYLIRYWCVRKLPGFLSIVVSPRFVQEHADVVDIADSYSCKTVEFTAISPEEEASLRSRQSNIGRNWRNFQEWWLFCHYAKQGGADRGLMMYLDTYYLPLAIGLKASCPISGIYFRPTFHYGEFPNYQPSWRERLQHYREKAILYQALRNPQLKTLFCLDPFVGKHLKSLYSQGNFVHLPDPVLLEPPPKMPPEGLVEKLGILSNRRVFLMFGALNERKGIFQVLDAILQLSPEQCQGICLLLVGESRISQELDVRIADICQVQPIQIIARYQFIPDEEISVYFQRADVILAPYQRHVGMSGILLLAAAFQKPVLSSNYGLMGEIVRRYKLGVTVDSTKITEIAQGLIQFLQKHPTQLCDRAMMQHFAEENTAERFAQTIFEHI